MNDKTSDRDAKHSCSAKSSSSFSKGAASLRVPISHRLPQKLVARHFARLDHAFYVSTKVLREQRRTSEAQAVEKQLDTLFSTFSDELAVASTDIRSTKAKIQAVNISEVKYDGFRELSVSVSTSFSTRLLFIIKSFDDYLVELDQLELSLCIAPEVCEEVVYQWRTKMLAFLSALSHVCSKPQI